MGNEQLTERKLRQLRTWNLVVGLILAVQAIMIAVLTNSLLSPGERYIYGRPSRHHAYTSPFV